MTKRCLIIKTSSLGDVIHMLPAITQAKQKRPDIVFDWVVEASFDEIPRWHKAIDEVIPVEIRKWRKHIIKHYRDIRQFKKRLKAQHYDYVIDAQGLIKSAWIAFLAKGVSYGLDKKSAREPISRFFYRHKVHVPKGLHAVDRLQLLLASVLDYKPELEHIDYGIQYQWHMNQCQNQVIFLHGTTWPSKHWCLSHWQALAKLFSDQGVKVLLPWGNDKEYEQACKIADRLEHVIVLPKLNLTELAKYFVQSKAVIAVDTGLSHLAAACHVPTLCIYGSTSAKLTGAKGGRVIHVSSKLTCSPCLKKVCPITKEAFAPCQVSVSAQNVYDRINQMWQQIDFPDAL
ncbi:lipopolysaccharide heptosyltransferase I [Facilibium subflavum]|uniref:lipopolysaccharide heptosyltransferase I n=1 Tax=Facilibium subflavum TaxID=2219058 RepID=UPI000E65612B|nr:lipopolysaccharide heptosyltransferase I [Facilibium subflavum]